MEVSEKEYLNKLEKILNNISKDNSFSLTLDSDLHNEIGLDSLDIYEFVFELEKEFKIKIKDEDVYKLKTPKDYLEYTKGTI
jgi:acyl carrier protein